MKIAYPELSMAMAKKRIEEADEVAAEIIASTCPFCENQLREAGDIPVYDVIDLLWEAREK